jgi:hypothetical protein
VKVRQSASLVAGVCTLCVAASGSVTPLPVASAAAPSESKSPVVARPFELTAAVSPIDTIVSLPYQDLIVALKAFAGVAGGGDGLGGAAATSLQGLPAIIYQAITQPTATSNLETLGAAFQTALATEGTALQNLGTLPERLLAPLTALSTLSATSKVTPAVEAAAIAPAATVDPVSTLVSLPYQNLITTIEAFAGVAGGADGLGTNGAKSLQALPAIIYQAITQPTATSNLETLGASFTTALGTEATALQNFATLPQRLITTDLNAISGVSSLTATKTTSPLALNKSADPSVKAGPLADITAVAAAPVVKTTPATTSKLADQGTDDSAPTGSTTPTRHAKKADGGPVANAVKSITKGSYVGKHRAASDNAKAGSKSDDGGSKHSKSK